MLRSESFSQAFERVSQREGVFCADLAKSHSVKNGELTEKGSHLKNMLECAELKLLRSPPRSGVLMFTTINEIEAYT